MGACFDEDVKEWREDIETTKMIILLLEEVRDKQIHCMTNMKEVDISTDFTRETFSTYKHFTGLYQLTTSCIQKIQKGQNIHTPHYRFFVNSGLKLGGGLLAKYQLRF